MTPSPSPSPSTGTGPDRSSTPNSGTPSNSHPSTPSNRTPNASNPSTPSNQHGPTTNHPTQNTPSTPGTPSTPNQPSAGPTPNKPPHQPTGNTPNTPQQPAAHPDKPENSQQNPDQQRQQQVTPVPIHTVVTTPPPSHADPTTPQNPGSPQATPNAPGNQNHPNQDSLDDIRADLDHYPGGLTEPDPADQQALADAVPRNDDGTPERFPDPHGPWSQLQNDGGNTVPGRSNNCADCSRSFLETWYGNPQVSAPRTVDTDANGNPDYWSPEDNANDNQIRWTGASHTYAGPGGDPNTANNIASVLQQSGPGSAAIVQVDWPGGGGHAFNVVNHNGNIVWIDTQSGDVSDQPLHLDQAEHVWHIPLDADRNPIDLSQPDATGSNQGTDTSQEGTDNSQDGSDNSQDGPDASQQESDDTSDQSSDDSKPGPETAQQDPQTSEDGPDTTQQEAHASPDTSESQNEDQSQSQSQQTNESDPSTEMTDDNPSDNSDATKPTVPDTTESENPDTTQSENPDTTKPTDPEPSQPKDPDTAEPETAETSQPKDPDPTQAENPDPTQSENPDSTQTGAPDSNPPTDPDSSPSTDPDASEAKDPDAAESTDPDYTTPEDSADGSPQDPSHQDPIPATATRDTTPPGGVTHPTPAEQQSLENSVPRDENGDPIRPPDPADGPWVRNINGDGADSPGRNNNCADVALSTVDTYAGNPTAAAARTPDPNPDGTPSDRGEKAGRDRIENTLGARFSDMGNGRAAFNRLENTLRNSGHGSQAVIITQDANGRAHAWNAVNHNSKITYIDAQTGRQSSKPLHSGNNGVFAIPLDSNRQSLPPGKPETEGSRADERQAPEAPGSTPDEPAGESLPRFDSEEVRGSAEFGERQKLDHTHENMPLEESQATLRKTHDVSQVDLGPVLENAHRWAEDGSLARVVDEVRKNKTISQDRLNEILGDDFKDLNNDQKMAVIAGIARISNSFHESHAAGNSPIGLDPERRRPKGEESEINPLPGVSMHDNTAIPRMKPDDNNPSPASRAREYAVSHEADNSSKEARDAKHDDFDKLWKGNKDDGMRPDMSGKNYAVLEVHEKVGDEVKVHYVIDTSVPGSDRYHHDHSEPHLGEWMRAVEEKHPGRFKAVSLFTEFEPCGNRTGTGGANCSDYLSHDMERDSDDPRARTKKARENRPEEQQKNPRKSDLRISYGIGYRKGDMGNEAAAREAEYDSPADRREAIKQAKAEDIAMRQQVKAVTDEQMVRYRGEWLRAWMTAAGSGAE